MDHNMTTLRACEGDLIETNEGLIFDVKGLVHPSSRVIAFVRYIPSMSGQRLKESVTYEKVYSLSERFDWLKHNYPQYLIYDDVFGELVSEVPVNHVRQHFRPVEKLQQLKSAVNLDSLETRCIQFANLLKEKAGILWDAIGISGSVLVALHTSTSDIDMLVYGSENCRKVHAALTELLQAKLSEIKSYTREQMKSLFDFRSQDTKTSFEEFVRTESRKVLEGKFTGKDYFVRFVKDWHEVKERYGDIHYRNAGYARIKATVADDSESIFTPCSYRVDRVKMIEGEIMNQIVEIASFRGRFCEQARTGETVVAQGKVERVRDMKENSEYFRLLIGNKPSDFMILA
jgi:predicted nucleotidyltransferase